MMAEFSSHVRIAQVEAEEDSRAAVAQMPHAAATGHEASPTADKQEAATPAERSQYEDPTELPSQRTGQTVIGDAPGATARVPTPTGPSARTGTSSPLNISTGTPQSPPRPSASPKRAPANPTDDRHTTADIQLALPKHQGLTFSHEPLQDPDASPQEQGAAQEQPKPKKKRGPKPKAQRSDAEASAGSSQAQGEEAADNQPQRPSG